MCLMSPVLPLNGNGSSEFSTMSNEKLTTYQIKGGEMDRRNVVDVTREGGCIAVDDLVFKCNDRDYKLDPADKKKLKERMIRLQ